MGQPWGSGKPTYNLSYEDVRRGQFPDIDQTTDIGNTGRTGLD